MTGRVAVVGSCNIDLVARTATLPRPGETVLASSYAAIAGGKGLNQAIAAARAGAECSIVAAVGDDANADVIRSVLRAAGVDVRRLRTVEGPSGTALIVVDDVGENSIVVIGGANRSLTALTESDRTMVAAADALLLQLEIPLEMVIAAATCSRGLRILNAAPMGPLPQTLLDAVDLLLVNEVEAAALAGKNTDVVAALLQRVPRVAVTRGAAGVSYGDRDGVRLEVPAPRVTAVDTTAAGDTFTGVLVAVLVEGRAIQQSLELACAAASLCVEAAGASGSIPQRQAIDVRWVATYGTAVR
ncbi:MAG: ribokinase [Gemmatimonadaceae bacterium]